MQEIKAYTPGIYARSEPVADRREADLRAFLEVQREAGLDYFSDGLLNWEDIFLPLEEAAEGLGDDPSTIELPKLIEPLGEPFFEIGNLPRGRWVATLPSPYALAERAELEPRAVAEGVLGPQIRWLAGNGCAYVVLQETALFGGTFDIYPLSEAIDALASPLPLALQLPLGDAGDLLGELIELEVHAIGVDVYATDVEALPRPFPKTLLAGVVDARNSVLEEPEELARFGRSLLEEMDEGTELHLVPNGDLRLVPQRVAREKVLRLGAAAGILRDTITEEGAVT